MEIIDILSASLEPCCQHQELTSLAYQVAGQHLIACYTAGGLDSAGTCCDSCRHTDYCPSGPSEPHSSSAEASAVDPWVIVGVAVRIVACGVIATEAKAVVEELATSDSVRSRMRAFGDAQQP